jgi:hypothetical protein
MVPLERILRKPGSDAVPGFALPELKPPPSDAAEPPHPRIFKVVDVVTRQVLADGVDARGAVTALDDVRSFVDATVYVWEPKGERWRMLTLGETRALWDHRGPIGQAAPLS